MQEKSAKENIIPTGKETPNLVNPKREKVETYTACRVNKSI